MFEVLRYEIPLRPVTKKNSQEIWKRGGRSFIVPSRAYREYEAGAMFYLRPKPKKPVGEAVNVKALFYMPDRRRVDLVNLQEALLDVLVKAGILEDDCAKTVASMDGSRVLYDKQDPRTVVVISAMES